MFLGVVELVWYTTESMVADVMTKTKTFSGSPDKRLVNRFYNDIEEPIKSLETTRSKRRRWNEGNNTTRRNDGLSKY